MPIRSSIRRSPNDSGSATSRHITAGVTKMPTTSISCIGIIVTLAWSSVPVSCATVASSLLAIAEAHGPGGDQVLSAFEQMRDREKLALRHRTRVFRCIERKLPQRCDSHRTWRERRRYLRVVPCPQASGAPLRTIVLTRSRCAQPQSSVTWWSFAWWLGSCRTAFPIWKNTRGAGSR
jgi:hypothetical protein